MPKDDNALVREKTRTSITFKMPARFDYSCRGDFKEAIQAGIDADEVVLDLAETVYVDSAALGMLVLLKNSCEAVRIENANGFARKILEVASFSDLITDPRPRGSSTDM